METNETPAVNTVYDSSATVVAGTYCLVCEEPVLLHWGECGPKICQGCREAILAMKKQKSKQE